MTPSYNIYWQTIPNQTVALHNSQFILYVVSQLTNASYKKCDAVALKLTILVTISHIFEMDSDLCHIFFGLSSQN